MSLGAAYGGLAIEHSMLGASHALANPLTAMYGIAHGQAVGVMLPHVIRYNGEEFDGWYRELLHASAGPNDLPPASSGSRGLADFVEKLVESAGLEINLQGCGVQREQIPALAEAAASQWTSQFNPRPVGSEILAQLYEQAY